MVQLFLLGTRVSAQVLSKAEQRRQDCNIYAAIFRQYPEDNEDCDLALLLWGKSARDRLDEQRALNDVATLRLEHAVSPLDRKLSAIVDGSDDEQSARLNIERSINAANDARQRLAESLMRIERDIDTCAATDSVCKVNGARLCICPPQFVCEPVKVADVDNTFQCVMISFFANFGR